MQRYILTGLSNRATIIECLQEKLSLSKRTRQPLGLILADIDFFKIINDRHGNLVGDAVLSEVSRRLRAQLRDSDRLGRYGGEDFLFVLHPWDSEGILNAAKANLRALPDACCQAGTHRNTDY